MRSTAALRTAGRLLARRLFLDRQAAFWRRELWDARARVSDIIVETADTKTFVLRPRSRWRGHRAGQYATLQLELDGVRVRRCYSISSTPGDPLVAVTVKRLPGGRASTWLHDRVRVGDAVALLPAAGTFVLPAPAPAQLLFLSGGCGITPIMSMLRQLARDGAMRDVVLVHHARRRADVIFGDALEALAAAHPGLRLVFAFSDEPSGRFDEQRFARLVPDFAARATFACGPPGLLARVEQLWSAAGASERLQRERFVGDVPPVRGDAQPVALRLARSERTIAGSTARTLLEQLEAAGVRPPHGCRRGICYTCRCAKRVGTVENLLTGALSREPDDEIQLCISVPRSDVELSL